MSDTVTITSPDGATRAEFVPAANLLCHSFVHDGGELLAHPHTVEDYAQRGKTMGIPLLYPWANRLAAAQYTVAGRTVELGDPDGRYPVDPNGLPIHGAMPGLMRWEITEHSEAELTARLDWSGETLLSLFPFRHHVEVQAGVAAGELRLTTTVLADGGDPVPVSFGYHPYLTLPGSDRAGWQVDLGASRHIEVDARQIPTGQTTELSPRDFLLADRSLDDGLAQLAAPAQFLVSDGERALSVSFEAGYAWGQVYSPDPEDFICFEPMTAPTDALRSGRSLPVVAPGERYRASVEFSARD